MWQRLGNVLALIVEGGGGNDLVETKRGKKNRKLEILPEIFETRSNYVAAALAAAAAAAPATAAVDTFNIWRSVDLEVNTDD